MMSSADLDPSSTYSFRVIPFFVNGKGAASSPIVVKTLASAVNYWEPVLPIPALPRGRSTPSSRPRAEDTRSV